MMLKFLDICALLHIELAMDRVGQWWYKRRQAHWGAIKAHWPNARRGLLVFWHKLQRWWAFDQGATLPIASLTEGSLPKCASTEGVLTNKIHTWEADYIRKMFFLLTILPILSLTILEGKICPIRKRINEGNLKGKISTMIHHLPHQTLDLRHLLDSSRYDLLALFGAIL